MWCLTSDEILLRNSPKCLIRPNEAQRIDSQLYGRCGRLGKPGIYESILSLDDELLNHYLSGFISRILRRSVVDGKGGFQDLALFAMRRGQTARVRRYLRIRRDLLQIDEQPGKLLAFSGGME